MYAIEVDHVDTDYSTDIIKIFESRYYACDKICGGNPYFAKNIANPDVYRFETIEETEEFLSEWYDFENRRFKICYLNDDISGTKPRIVSVPMVVKDYEKSTSELQMEEDKIIGIDETGHGICTICGEEIIPETGGLMFFSGIGKVLLCKDYFSSIYDLKFIKNQCNYKGVKLMGVEIKAIVSATCDKCGKQERIKEMDRNSVQLPDGWMNISDQGVFCEECYKKYEEEQKKKDGNVFNHIGNHITQKLKKIITESDEHTITLNDALEFIEFYGLRNLFNSQGDMHYVGMVACEVLDKAIENGEIMICKNALKHKE